MELLAIDLHSCPPSMGVFSCLGGTFDGVPEIRYELSKMFRESIKT